MSVIEELYYGNINSSGMFIKKYREFYKINKRLTENIDVFVSKLGKSENELLV